MVFVLFRPWREYIYYGAKVIIKIDIAKCFHCDN